LQQRQPSQHRWLHAQSAPPPHFSEQSLARLPTVRLARLPTVRLATQTDNHIPRPCFLCVTAAVGGRTLVPLERGPTRLQSHCASQCGCSELPLTSVRPCLKAVLGDRCLVLVLQNTAEGTRTPVETRKCKRLWPWLYRGETRKSERLWLHRELRDPQTWDAHTETK
jgi:hypothetical protein